MHPVHRIYRTAHEFTGRPGNSCGARPLARLDAAGSVALITQGGLVTPGVTVPAAPVAAPRQPAATARQVAEDQAHRHAQEHEHGETMRRTKRPAW